MTDEQINIAIAEACGWNPPPEGMGNMTHGGGKFMSSEEWRKSHLPNYCNDLNAMHEAEATLDFEQAELFEDELCDVTFKNNDGLENPLPCRFSVCHATSRQRAEAFLKTIKKWNSDKI
jgi:hypothetical protein